MSAAADLDWLEALPIEARKALLIEAQSELSREKIADYRPYPKQRLFHEFGRTKRERLLRAGNQNGKALKHGTPVLTPTGWTSIEALSEGDRVIAGDGTPTLVTGVFPQGMKPVFRLTFDDGASTVCCGEHLWVYQHPQARFAAFTDRGSVRRQNKRFGQWTVGDTAGIIKAVGMAPGARRRVVMPYCGIVQMDEASVPLDPYLVGLLIGDGSLTAGVGFSTADAELADAVARCLPCGMVLTRGKKYAYRLALTGGKANGGSAFGNPIKRALDGLGLYGKLAHEKFVPDGYKYNSAAVRLAVLQGLLDTDGSVGKEGQVEFCSVSRALANDVVYLVQSFGGKAWIRERVTHFTYLGVRKAGRLSFRVRIRLPQVVPFRLQRKVDRLKRAVSTTDYRVLYRIEPAGDAQCTCISVAHPARTFVIEHGLVTHNSFCVGCEAAYHLTGEYPSDWPGRRWERPTIVWASGETGEATRDNAQRVLIGLPKEEGTGAIPARCLGEYGKASGTADLYDYYKVRHVCGGWSMLRLKYYAQGSEKWQGPPVDFVWFDEEPPEDIYDEGLARTIATGGMVALSFTPLKGMSAVVMRFLGDGATDDRADVNMTIDDAEHIPVSERARIIASFPAHQRDARARGIPTLGSGAIFPVDEASIKVDPFAIPDHWPRLCGLDFGWDHPTAAVWMAWDRESDTIYVYDAYRVSEQPVPIHAAAIRAKGGWIPVAWPHDGWQTEKGSGVQLAEQYRTSGVAMLAEHATFAETGNADETQTSRISVEAGLQEMLTRMQTGRWKVFSHLADWFGEFRLYHRDDGKIVKKFDDLMSASRYAMMMLRHAVVETKARSRGRRPPPDWRA